MSIRKVLKLIDEQDSYVLHSTRLSTPTDADVSNTGVPAENSEISGESF